MVVAVGGVFASTKIRNPNLIFTFDSFWSRMALGNAIQCVYLWNNYDFPENACIRLVKLSFFLSHSFSEQIYKTGAQQLKLLHCELLCAEYSSWMYAKISRLVTEKIQIHFGWILGRFQLCWCCNNISCLDQFVKLWILWLGWGINIQKKIRQSGKNAKLWRLKTKNERNRENVAKKGKINEEMMKIL